MMLLPFLPVLGGVLGLLASTGVARAAGAPATESEKANALFERAWQDTVERSPLLQAQLGIKRDQDQWGDFSDAFATESLARSVGYLAELRRTVDFGALDRQTQLSHRIFTDQVERQVRGFPYRFHDYPVSQNGGLHTMMPTFLINLHRVEELRDAEAYVARLRGVGPLFAQLRTGLEERRARGIVPPRWVFPPVAQSIRGLMTGVPLDPEGADHPLWADFQRKLAALTGVDEAQRRALREEARGALRDVVKPAYEQLLQAWAQLEAFATDEDGVWKLPQGEAFYAQALADMNSLPLSAPEIHEIGLQEVARLHGEMRALLPRLDFPGDLPGLFRHVREDSRFYFPGTPEGRAAYLERARAVIDEIRGRLDELFLLQPKAGMEVRATEAFRERTAPKAFYQRGTPDGSRPGVYYVTLYDMREMPTYQLEAIAYHEGIPGHHMQISIAQELTGVPSFRRMAFYGAYLEGWALYGELLPKEIGLYRDPYSDFGRLAMELWRAVRLVVDTGIHAKRWTRRQAIDYFLANTPQSEGEVVREIERYIVMPAQATTYKIGMIKILDLRERAKRELGARFNLRAFHDVLLQDGAVPLTVLEEKVRAWIEQRKR